MRPLIFFAYGLGHILNDACAIMWFSYGLFFLHELCNMPAATSGLVLFAGQIADAIATPLAGILSDATPRSMLGGRRLVWIALGSVCVVVTFPRFFSPHVAQTPKWSALAASLFNVGWAMTQVSHLALAPDLGGNERTQLLLSAMRQVATVLASIGAFMLVRCSLLKESFPQTAAVSALVFHECALKVVTFGALTTALCIALIGTSQASQQPQGDGSTREEGQARQKQAGDAAAPDGLKLTRAKAERAVGGAKVDSDANGPANPRANLARSRQSTAELLADEVSAFGRWLSKGVFWHVGLLYTCARLSINLTATYVPLLMLEICGRSVNEVATVPILMYTFQIVGAVGAERLAVRVGKSRALLLNALVSAGGSLALRLLRADAWRAIVCAVCAQSLASSGVLVLVVALQAGAARSFPSFGHGFLYGTHSMLDKLSSGCAIVLLQRLAQQSDEGGMGEDGMAARGGAAARSAFVIGACVLPLCASLCAALLVAPLARRPEPEWQTAGGEPGRQAKAQLDADILSQQLLPGHP